jgi:hypothetical protein
MDRTLLLMEGILMHDEDDRSALRLSDRSNCTNLDQSQLVIINASDINNSIRDGNDANVTASNSTIGSAIDESASNHLGMIMSRDASGTSR